MKPADLEQLLDLATIVAYGAATWDWYGMHYDPQIVAEAKLPAPIVDGQMLGALLAKHALGSAPEGARVTHMSFRFKAMVFAGDTVRCTGEVASSDGRKVRIKQRIAVGDRVAIEDAWTELELPE
jgi:acyl dehydratase